MKSQRPFQWSQCQGKWMIGDTCYSCFLLTMACPLLDDVLHAEAIRLRGAWRKKKIFYGIGGTGWPLQMNLWLRGTDSQATKSDIYAVYWVHGYNASRAGSEHLGIEAGYVLLHSGSSLKEDTACKYNNVWAFISSFNKLVHIPVTAN